MYFKCIGLLQLAVTKTFYLIGLKCFLKSFLRIRISLTYSHYIYTKRATLKYRSPDICRIIFYVGRFAKYAQSENLVTMIIDHRHV